jgi:anthranilate synthase component 2
MKVLIIDNFDSFTYNLYQAVGELLENAGRPFILDVVRNNAITVKQIQEKSYNRIIISPGPGSPADANYFGVCREVILKIGKTVPVLGVCLGMQGIAHYFGGKVIRSKQPMHGQTSEIRHEGKRLFKNIPQNISVMRYHSLVVKADTLPSSLEITARTSRQKEPEIMGLRHKIYPVAGVQFHPESFATEFGKKIISNFLFQNE